MNSFHKLWWIKREQEWFNNNWRRLACIIIMQALFSFISFPFRFVLFYFIIIITSSSLFYSHLYFCVLFRFICHLENKTETNTPCRLNVCKCAVKWKMYAQNKRLRHSLSRALALPSSIWTVSILPCCWIVRCTYFYFSFLLFVFSLSLSRFLRLNEYCVTDTHSHAFQHEVFLWRSPTECMGVLFEHLKSYHIIIRKEKKRRRKTCTKHRCDSRRAERSTWWHRQIAIWLRRSVCATN